MPETPPERDGLVVAIDQLSAYLADGEVDERGVAWGAGEAGAAANDARWPGEEVEAESASEDVGLGGSWHHPVIEDGIRRC